MCAKCEVSCALPLMVLSACEHCLTVSKVLGRIALYRIKDVRARDAHLQMYVPKRLTNGKIALYGIESDLRGTARGIAAPQSDEVSYYSASVLKDSTFSTTMPPRLPLGSLPLLFLLSTDISSVLTVQTLALSYTATCTLLSALHANTT